MGLAYGLVSETINLIFLPGVPLFNPGPSPLGSIVLTTLGGGIIGLLAAWPEETLPGILLASLAGALLTVILTLDSIGGGLDAFAGTFVLLVMTFLPRAFLFLPMAALVRWVLGVWANELESVSFSVRKMALAALGLMLVSGLAGLLSLYPSFARQALLKTNALVQKGMQSQSVEGLTETLKPVDGFLQGARGSYTLELSDNPDILPVQRPIGPYGEQEYVVFVRFENGFRFGCAFTPTHEDPSCGEY
jgi:hypothetical protein